MSKKALSFIVLALALLAGLFLLLRPQPAAQSASAAAAGPTGAPAANIATVTTPAPVLPKTFELTLRDGQRVAGPAVLPVRVGDEVVLRVTSNVADELHLHGYDLHVELQPGVPAELRFKAVHSGRFDYELHHAGAEIGALEVQPQ